VPAPDWPADGLAQAPWLRRFSHSVVLSLFEGLWGLKVSGLENIPARGPVIVAANHVSNLDGPVLAVAVGEARFMRALAKIELFQVPVLGAFLRRTGSIPIDRRGDVKALRSALDLLERGGCLAVMPEGTRSKTGVPGRARAGLGFLAGQSGAVVVPAHILNTDRFWKFQPLEVRFGPPLRFEGDAADRGRCRIFAQDVLDRLLTL
jgi:1-acyl-sn-glycerol-3-phosphate acyltransferase